MINPMSMGAEVYNHQMNGVVSMQDALKDYSAGQLTDDVLTLLRDAQMPFPKGECVESLYGEGDQIVFWRGYRQETGEFTHVSMIALPVAKVKELIATVDTTASWPEYE